VNLTRGRSFREFAAEVRSGCSHVVVMPELPPHLVARTMAGVADVLGQDGRRRWTDRVTCLGRACPAAAISLAARRTALGALGNPDTARPGESPAAAAGGARTRPHGS
jgi:hypothetical protein